MTQPPIIRHTTDERTIFPPVQDHTTPDPRDAQIIDLTEALDYAVRVYRVFGRALTAASAVLRGAPDDVLIPSAAEMHDMHQRPQPHLIAEATERVNSSGGAPRGDVQPAVVSVLDAFTGAASVVEDLDAVERRTR